MLRIGIAAAMAAALMSTAANAATEITWWHAMSGALGERVDALAKAFNESQSDYVVTPVFKGSYGETLTAAIAAFRAGQQPDIVQVYEVGTGTMMAAKGAVYPVYQLFADQGLEWKPDAFLAPVVGYYSDPEGNILSQPFNSSTPILYYNKDVFAKAGLDPEVAPKTWADIDAFTKKIVESGAAKCGFTISYAATWVGSENFLALHDLPYGTLQNGFGGLGAELVFNQQPLLARFWDQLKTWQGAGQFKYGGPDGGADTQPSFFSQECAIFLGSSASRAGITTNAKDFQVGYGPLPYYDDAIAEPKNSIIGGATLWVFQGKPAEDYKAVAAFFSYLQKPEVQAEWHQATGYLPITNAAYDLGMAQGYYTSTPGSDIAIKQITRGTPSDNSKGVRFGNLTQIRAIMDQQFEAVLSGAKTAQQALDEAAAQGNVILRDFQAANE